MLETIQGLWIGPRLSTMEQLSIRSFLAHGHAYDLYVYRPTSGVPAGATVRDASEILPPESLFISWESYAAFSDVFRWRLLFERGGWWVDLDVVALRPFEFSEERVFATQSEGQGSKPTSGVARAPAGDLMLAWMCGRCDAKDKSRLAWSELGPDLVAQAIDNFDSRVYLAPPEVFCPLAWENFQLAVTSAPPAIPPDAYAVHLWASMWKRAGMDKDRSYPVRSLYESLKARYPCPPLSA
jgi:hypothetical protein